MITFTKEEVVEMVSKLRGVIIDLRHYYSTASVDAYKIEEIQNNLLEKLNEDETVYMKEGETVEDNPKGFVGTKED